MRIAWIGPMPNDEGGASGVSNQLLRELNMGCIEVDCYVPGDEAALPNNLRTLQNIRFICVSSGWQWGKWYSRNRLMSFITGQLSNFRCENRLAHLLVDAHRARPYDVIYQFSHIEFSILRRYKQQLPPIVLHPSVHAQGELRWHRLEAHLSAECEPLFLRMVARTILWARSWVQRRHIHVADQILGLSQAFMDELQVDYNVPSDKVRLVPNPIDTDRFVLDVSRKQQRDRLTILFVSRIAVRKGVELMIDVSHRLDDLAGQIEIRVIGDRSQWSDYTRLLQRLNPRTATFVGSISGKGNAMVDLYQSAHILIQPSRYEPFGLTVGEALACGTPVIASSKVGAAENVDSRVCRVFADGNVEELEREVRALVAELHDPTKAEFIYRRCRAECERLYGATVVTSKLLASLTEVCASVPSGG